MYNQWANNSFIILVMRLIVGGSIFMHGTQKVLAWYGGPGIDGTVGFMSKMGIPPFLAYLSIYTEFIGGLLIIIGLLTRISSIALFINMLVAIVNVHLSKGFFASTGGFELALFYLAFAFLIILTGPGMISLDNLIFKDRNISNEKRKDHS